MSVSVANQCHEFLSQTIKHHRVLAAWSLGANVNERDQHIAVLRVDFCPDSSSKWEKDFSFNQRGYWSSECLKANRRLMKLPWQAEIFKSRHLMSRCISHFSKIREDYIFLHPVCVMLGADMTNFCAHTCCWYLTHKNLRSTCCIDLLCNFLYFHYVYLTSAVYCICTVHLTFKTRYNQ